MEELSLAVIEFSGCEMQNTHVMITRKRPDVTCDE